MGKILFGFFTLIILFAIACGGSGGASASFSDAERPEAIADDVRLEPTPTVETQLGEYGGGGGEITSLEDRGFGAPQEIALGEEFMFQEVTTVTVDFRELVSDNRCAEGNTCEDPGQAVVKLGVRSGGMSMGASDFVIEAGAEGEVKKLGRFSVQLVDLTPLPNADGTLGDNYVATVLVFRQ